MNAKMKRITRKALAFFAGMAAVALIQSTPAQAFQFTFELQDMTSGGTPVFYSSWSQITPQPYFPPPGNGPLMATNQLPILAATIPYAGGNYAVAGGTYNQNLYDDGTLRDSSTSVFNSTTVTVSAHTQLAASNFTDLMAGIHMVANAFPYDPSTGAGSIVARFYYDGTGLVNSNVNPGSGSSLNAASYKPIAGYGAPIWTTPLYSWTGADGSFQNLTKDLPVIANNPYGMAVEFDLTLAPDAGISLRNDSMNSTAVPEPTTYVLLGLSLGVVGFARRKMVRNA